MLPESSNVFGIIYSNLAKEEIAKRFEKIGWRIGKSSWFDWEIMNDYSELIIEGDGEILIHGQLDPDFFYTLIDKMKEIELQFSLELYDENKKLLSEVRHL